ncbi:hypothetical protein EBY67_03415 [bacterium]|nr:hypothetical protein [bacterium]
MFIFNNQPLSPDSAFTDPKTGIQYPSNWLRLASPEERAAIGITEAPDPAPYDQRFYWSPDLPKDHGQLVEQWISTTRTTANTLLAPTDWQVIREADNSKPMDAAIKADRQLIRDAAGIRIAAINATTTTEELAAYITSAGYSDWNSAPVRVPSGDVVSFSNGFTSSGFGL